MGTSPRHTHSQLCQESLPLLNPLLKLGSQVFTSKLNNPPSFLPFETWTGRTVHFYLITQYLRLSSGVWEVEESRSKRRGSSALPPVCSVLCQNSAQMETRVSPAPLASSLDVPVGGDAVSGHLPFLLNPHHSLSGFFSPQENI